MTEKQSKTPPQLADELARATRALTRAGFTLVEGAQEWKPPIGPSASPLLDRIDRLAELLNEAKDSVWYHADHHGSEDAEDLMARINAALAGNLPERRDTAWDDAVVLTKTATDYRELQAQHDQLQSRLKATMDMLRWARGYVEYATVAGFNMDNNDVIEAVERLPELDAALAGQVPAQAVPEGWQLVPVEPTTYQVLVGRNAKPMDDELCVAIYFAMLAAAPKPEGAA